MLKKKREEVKLEKARRQEKKRQIAEKLKIFNYIKCRNGKRKTI